MWQPGLKHSLPPTLLKTTLGILVCPPATRPPTPQWESPITPRAKSKTSCPGVGEKQCKGTRFMEHGEHKYSDYQEV